MLAYAFIIVENLGKMIFVLEKNKLPKWMIVFLLVTGIMAIINLKFGGNDFYTCTVRNRLY